MDPLDEYLLRKEAGFWGDFVTGKGVGGDVRSAAIGAAVTAGAAAAVPAVNKLYGAITKRRDFNNMMSANPQLQDARAEDPKRFNQMYSSLRIMNRDFAADPLVAGGLMHKMTQDPMIAANTLMEISKNQIRPMESPMQKAFMQGAGKGPYGKYDPKHDASKQDATRGTGSQGFGPGHGGP